MQRQSVTGAVRQITLTAQQKAQFVAESIALQTDEVRAWDWSIYGLESNAAMRAQASAG